MNFPKENIWQEFRAACLDAIPRGSHVSPERPITLQAWQKRGCFVVQNTTAKRFELSASSIEFGSALLTDAEYLLDNAAEHQVSLWKHVHSSDWMSPAWAGVTVYYWAFYLSLAITRLTGQTAWFLTKDAVRSLKRLAANPGHSPGAGCYKFACGETLSITDRALVLQKSNARIHDAIWRMLFSSCASKLDGMSADSSNSFEGRIFTAVSRSAQYLGEDWPSAFRNAVNYRSGFAYTAVRGRGVLKSLGYLKQHSYDVEDMVNRLENAAVAARQREAISNAPQAVMELLVAVTFFLHALATELHRELVERHGLDKRWGVARGRFLRNQGLKTSDGFWPA